MNIDRISNTKKNFNRASSTYDQEAVVHKKVAKYLYTHLNKSHEINKILDIGSGTSLLSEFVTRNFSEEIIINTDISEEMLKVGKNKYCNSQFILSDMQDLPFGADFDLVLSSMSLQWLEEPKKIAEVIFKNLKSGGSFAFSVVLKGTFNRITRLRKAIVGEPNINNPDISSQAERLPDFEDLKAALTSANLILSRSEKHLFKHSYENAEDCFTAIRNLGIAGVSNRKLTQEEFKNLVDSYKQELSELDLNPELDYNVGFFWGRKL